MIQLLSKLIKNIQHIKIKIFYKILPINHNPYLIRILKIYYDQTKQELMIHFKYHQKDLISTRYALDFINSKLIYFVHPKQLIMLGGDFRDYLLKRSQQAPCHNLTRVYHEPE